MIKKNIILVGFMGSGKTSVGAKLADMLKMEFYDTDVLIEEQTRMSIPEIFKLHGEEYFRQKEKQVAEILSMKKGCVISTGGGFVLQPHNMMHLKNSGTIVWLKASLESIFQRLKSYDSRPKLYQKELIDIYALYNERNELYLRYADICIETDGKTIDQVTEEIYKIII